MDNFLPFSSSNANAFQELSMDLDNNHTQFTTFPTYDDHHYQHHHHQMLPPPYPDFACPMVMNPQPETFSQIPVTPMGSLVRNPGLRQERIGFHDPQMTKMARINRKNAMVRSRNNPSPSSSSSSCSNELAESRRQAMLNIKTTNDVQIPEAEKDVYPYSTFDNKKLRVLLVKHLKNSDVGSLGRIVLPKREAEANLPQLSDKEGLIIEMRDVNSMRSFKYKYKFWSNNKSRMYVLENTGEFVRKNGVEMGDSLTIYEDESKNLYFSVGKPNKQNEVKGDQIMQVNQINYNQGILFDYMPHDEQEASIEMLIGNLNEQYPLPNDLMNFTGGLPDHVDHMTNPPHVGPSNDNVALDDFWWGYGSS